MLILNIFNNWDTLFEWVILPLLIFVARITDQSIGTLRVVFISKGYKKIVPILGFCEAFIWLLVIREILNNVPNPLCFIAYAAGFGTGNYIGLLIEERLSIGNVIVRVITRKEEPGLMEELRDNNFGYTLIDAEGSHNKVKVIFAVLNRKDLQKFLFVLNKATPDAFYTIEEVKDVKEGIFPSTKKKFGSFL